MPKTFRGILLGVFWLFVNCISSPAVAAEKMNVLFIAADAGGPDAIWAAEPYEAANDASDLWEKPPIAARPRKISGPPAVRPPSEAEVHLAMGMTIPLMCKKLRDHQPSDLSQVVRARNSCYDCSYNKRQVIPV